MVRCMKFAPSNPPYDSDEAPEGDFAHLKAKKYMGQPVDSTPLKVRCVYLDPIYFEIVEPLGEAQSPWHDHLKQHGTSVCFISLYIEGFEQHIDLMGKIAFRWCLRRRRALSATPTSTR